MLHAHALTTHQFISTQTSNFSVYSYIFHKVFDFVCHHEYPKFTRPVIIFGSGVDEMYYIWSQYQHKRDKTNTDGGLLPPTTLSVQRY